MQIAYWKSSHICQPWWGKTIDAKNVLLYSKAHDPMSTYLAPRHHTRLISSTISQGISSVHLYMAPGRTHGVSTKKNKPTSGHPAQFLADMIWGWGLSTQSHSQALFPSRLVPRPHRRGSFFSSIVYKVNQKNKQIILEMRLLLLFNYFVIKKKLQEKNICRKKNSSLITHFWAGEPSRSSSNHNEVIVVRVGGVNLVPLQLSLDNQLRQCPVWVEANGLITPTNVLPVNEDIRHRFLSS